MNLPGPKRLRFSMPKEVADENRDDIVFMLEGLPFPEPDESGVIQFDFVGRDISFRLAVERIMATDGVNVLPVF